jgi:hypothetical protein
MARWVGALGITFFYRLIFRPFIIIYYYLVSLTLRPLLLITNYYIGIVIYFIDAEN